MGETDGNQYKLEVTKYRMLTEESQPLREKFMTEKTEDYRSF